MLLIVAHHYVVNSGLTEVLEQQPLSVKSLFYYWFGMWGKIGINCFILITGYFMCKQSITVRKFLKLLMQIEFYKIIIYAIFVLSEYEPLSIKGLAKAILPVYDISHDFSQCFILFYLCIPFLNILIQNLDKAWHLRLLLLCLTIYTLFATLPKFGVTMNYISWFCVLYILSSYLRIYDLTPPNLFSSTSKTWGMLTLSSMAVSMLSVVVTLYVDKKYGLAISPYRWVADSNTLLAVITAVCSFMFFKDIKLKYHPLINLVGACTFGVLLIHANSDTMRQWLWKDVLDNAGHYFSANFMMHAILSVVIIFIICAVIDYVRQRTIEKWLFCHIDKLMQKRDAK